MYSDLISDPDVGKAFKYHAKYPGVMQGSQEGKRAKLCGPRAHFGANISLKIVLLFLAKNAGFEYAPVCYSMVLLRTSCCCSCRLV